jgi:hypothetical protein
MTPSQLKQNVEKTGSCFFSRTTMKIFGDTMANYGCHGDKLDKVNVWCLYRKSPVNHGLRANTYFRKDNFKRIFERIEE